MDLSNIDLSSVATPKNFMGDFMERQRRDMERTLMSVEKERERKERREEENRENLKITAENTEIVIDKLEKQIQQKDEDLQNQRDLIKILKIQLDGINKALNDMFILEEMNNEKQEEVLNVARDIYALMIQKKRIDWKTLIADKGFDIVISAVPIVLQLANVL